MPWYVPWLMPCVTCVRDPIVVRHAAYIFYVREKIKKATDAMEDLKAKRNDFLKKIQEGESIRKKRTNEVDRWLNKVLEMEVKIDSIKDKFEKWGCLIAGCPLNFCVNYNVGRNAALLLKELDQMKNEASKFEDIVVSLPPSPVRDLNYAANIVGETMKSNVEKVNMCLRDDAICIIGIWGMPGVGKTTLLKLVNEHFLYPSGDGANVKLFDHVIWAVASRVVNLQKIREDISRSLGLVGDSKYLIFNVLKNKSFLLLLDDVWNEINFDDIGIPDPHRRAPDKPRQKVILTSRIETVCAHMQTNKRIRVDVLNKNDAIKLFVGNVGEETINAHPQIRVIAEKVVMECRGLPLSLITTGRALSTKRSPREWQSALDSLQQSLASEISDTQKSMMLTLKFSYDNLRDDTLRACFLSIAIWPEDWNIRKDDLVERWLGQGLIPIDDFKNIKEAYDRGHLLIGNLLEACLLEVHAFDFNISDELVKVHDMVRDMALWIASTSANQRNNWIIETVIASEVESQIQQWVNAGQVHLDVSSDEEVQLPQPPKCPNLLSLTLKGTCLHSMPPGFFQSMSSLTYLNLSNSSIDMLPADIACLTELQYLNIAYTDIIQLPMEVASLTKLRFLSMFCDGYLFEDRVSIGSRLPSLRILDLLPDGELNSEELKCLKSRVRGLSMTVSSVDTLKLLPQVPAWRLALTELDGLTSLKMQVLGLRMARCLEELEIDGCNDLGELVMDADRILLINKIYPLQHLQNLILARLPQLTEITWIEVEPARCFERLLFLRVHECSRLTDATWVAQLPCLIELKFSECHGLVEIIKAEEIELEGTVKYFLPSLRRLEVKYCPNLRSICSPTSIFRSLDAIRLEGCPQLRTLPFHTQMAGNKLRRIRGQPEWWENLEWEDKYAFEPYFSVTELPEDQAPPVPSPELRAQQVRNSVAAQGDAGIEVPSVNLRPH